MTRSERPYFLILPKGADPNTGGAKRDLADALLTAGEGDGAAVWWSWGWEKVEQIEDLPHNVRCDGLDGDDLSSFTQPVVIDGIELSVPCCSKCGWSAVQFDVDDEEAS